MVRALLRILLLRDPNGDQSRGERSRSLLLFQNGGTENTSNFAVNVLAVNFWLLTVPSASTSYALYVRT